MCSVVARDQGEPERVPLELLERQICELAADLAAATYRWLLLVAEFDARDGWREWGVNSCAHWLSWRVGIGLSAAREHVRVARSLGALPLVSRGMASGELSFSKVRAITRVAQPETEEQLVELAQHATGAQLDRLVQGYASVIRATRSQALEAAERQHVEWAWGADKMLHLQARLLPEDGVRLINAIDAAESDDISVPRRVRRAEALATLAMGDAEAARGSEIVVHVDAETLGAEATVQRSELETGPAIAPETARRLGCDGSTVRILEQDGQPLSVGRRTRVISPALRRALKSRDRGCRFPGCTHTQFLHAHHIKHWAHGGRTDITNLVQLCSHHHRAVHEGGFRVDLDPSGAPRFRSPSGAIIAPVGERGRSQGAPLRWQNHAAGIDVDADTCRPRSAGDRLDYGIAVEGLARKWLPPPGPAPGQ